MASKPGIFTDWPWKKLGNFKYVILAPWVAHSLYTFMEGGEEKDLSYLLLIPLLLWRWLHSQLWISFARFQTAKRKQLSPNKSIEFEQVDRERNWDDQIILHGLSMYVIRMFVAAGKKAPLWRAEGAVITVLLHTGPVEFLYYWLHRALHHHYLYSRYHSHHHSSIATEPITSVIHPFMEMTMYFTLFSIPWVAMLFTGTISLVTITLYSTYIDFMNNLGHCNFEMVPKSLFTIFPFLKYFMYTPSFHSLHHSQFRTNYCLFMPIYDHLYGTVDKASDALYEESLKGNTETPDVVHLTHPTTLDSIYHLRLGFADVASKPYSSRWYLWMLWPITSVSILLSWIFDSTFTVEMLKLNKLKMQTWAVPRFSFQYFLPWQRALINKLIEKAIVEAEVKGVKVMTLGLLNQTEELNKYGDLYLEMNPKLKIRIVDGSSLAAAVVIKSIPEGTKEVLVQGKPSKTGYLIAQALCKKGLQVNITSMDELMKLKQRVPEVLWNYLACSNSYTSKVWLTGNGLTDEEQYRAPKGTYFIPFSQFPLKKLRKDCSYLSTPALVVPEALQNMHSCENWLPRKVMSACRVAGIVHALEGWNEHECGDMTLDMDKVWNAAIGRGFLPINPI